MGSFVKILIGIVALALLGYFGADFYLDMQATASAEDYCYPDGVLTVDTRGFGAETICQMPMRAEE